MVTIVKVVFCQFQVKCASQLVQHRVRQDQIVILSQYRAQSAEIEKRLLRRQLSSITVSTVVASQGKSSFYRYIVKCRV
jgi:superfamily I DNA and/or RNA helicase